MSFLKRNRQRIEQARRDAAEAEAKRRAVESKWPEVRRAAKVNDRWGRTMLDRDGFAEALVQIIQGGTS